MSDLRDQIAEAVAEWAYAYPISSNAICRTDEGAQKLARIWGEQVSRAVMPVIEPALLAEQVAATERADTLAARLQQAEREADRLDELLIAERAVTRRYQLRAHHAEAAVERVRDAGKVHRVAHPSPVGGCPACHILAALDQPGPAVTGDDVRDAITAEQHTWHDRATRETP